MVHSKVTPVIGLPQFTGWSQISESVRSSDGQLVCVFSVSGQHAGSVGRDVASRISEYTFQDGEQLQWFFNNLVAFVSANSCVLSFSCMASRRGLNIFVTFSGVVFLKRLEKTGVILFSNQEIVFIQGKKMPEDIVVLATMHAYDYLNEIEQKFLQGYDTDSIITSIVPGIHSQVDSSLYALAFVTPSQEVQAVLDSQQEAAFVELTTPEEPVLDSSQQFAQSVQSQAQEVIKKQPFFSVGKIAEVVKGSMIGIGRGLFTLSRVSYGLGKTFIRRFTKKSRSLDSLANSRIKIWRLVAAALVAGLIVLGFFWYSYQQKKELERVSGLTTIISEKRLASQEMLQQDPIVARNMLEEALVEVQVLEKQEGRSTALFLIQDEYGKLKELIDSSSAVRELEQLPIFYDLRLIKSDFIATTLAMSDNTLLILDAEQRRTVFLDVENKQVKLTEFSDQENITAIAFKNNQAVALGSGIYTYTPDTFDSPKQVKPEGDSNKDGKFIASYDRFVYVLNPVKRNVYRYAESDSGYSDPIGWIQGVSSIEYDTITSVSVDSAVWLTTATGDIKKLVSGRQEPFTLRGIEAFENAILGYTDEKLENLYILEPKLSRIVILKKNGDFITEVRSPVLASATGMVADESANKIFISSGSLIFELPIQQPQ